MKFKDKHKILIQSTIVAYVLAILTILVDNEMFRLLMVILILINLFRMMTPKFGGENPYGRSWFEQNKVDKPNRKTIPDYYPSLALYFIKFIAECTVLFIAFINM